MQEETTSSSRGNNCLSLVWVNSQLTAEFPVILQLQRDQVDPPNAWR